MKKVEIDFMPDSDGSFENDFEFETNYDRAVLAMHGEAVNELSITNAGSISFLHCPIAAIRRGVVRLSNFSEEKIHMKAKVSLPFRCPVPEFDIKSNSYVLLPVHFAPNGLGTHNCFLELESNKGKKTKIKLSGVCSQ